MNARTAATVIAVALALAGCGLKGPLYLPEKPGPVTTRPGPESATPPATDPAEPSPAVPSDKDEPTGG